jgi:hypothetical protein
MARNWLTLLPLCLVALACRPDALPQRQSEPVSRDEAAVGGQQATAPPTESVPSNNETAAIALSQVGIPSSASDDTLDNPDWTIEKQSGRLQQMFNDLAEALQAAAADDAPVLRQLASTDFRATPLIPSRLQAVYQDDVLTVRRSAEPLPAATATDDDARPGSADRAISSLRQQLAGWSERHVKFKLYSVGQQQSRLETKVDVALSGHSSTDHRQISAVWTCWWTLDGDDFRLSEIRLDDYEEVTARAGAGFVDATREVFSGQPAFAAQLAHGMDYWLDRLEDQFGIIPAGYHGVTVGDINGDGLDDLFVPQPGGVLAGLPNRVFVQRDDGALQDVSAESGLDWTVETHGALLVDLDNDGDQDAVVATVLGLVFAENDGQGHFGARVAKLTPEAPPMSLAAADFDQDGDLDIYVCCYSQRASSPLMGRPIPYHDANNGGRNILFRNDRDWRFRNATRQVGLDQNNRRFSFAAVWEDFDNDGDLDLYVANDYGRNNLYRNQDGTFTDVAAELGVEDISAGMSVSCGDYNRDGWMDLYVSNMWSSAGNRIAYQRRFQPAADPRTLASFQRHARGNSLFANRLAQPNGGFEDVSVAAAVTLGRWAWASLFADLNNDGWEDLVVTNGFITQEDTHDL